MYLKQMYVFNAYMLLHLGEAVLFKHIQQALRYEKYRPLLPYSSMVEFKIVPLADRWDTVL